MSPDGWGTAGGPSQTWHPWDSAGGGGPGRPLRCQPVPVQEGRGKDSRSLAATPSLRESPEAISSRRQDVYRREKLQASLLGEQSAPTGLSLRLARPTRPGRGGDSSGRSVSGRLACVGQGGVCKSVGSRLPPLLAPRRPRVSLRPHRSPFSRTSQSWTHAAGALSPQAASLGDGHRRSCRAKSQKSGFRPGCAVVTGSGSQRPVRAAAAPVFTLLRSLCRRVGAHSTMGLAIRDARGISGTWKRSSR